MKQQDECTTKLLGPEDFLIADRRYLHPLNQNFNEIEAKAKAEGRLMVAACCEPTAELLREAVKLRLTFQEFDVFFAALVEHPYRDFKRYKNQDEPSRIESYTDDLILVAESIERKEIRAAFVEMVFREFHEKLYNSKPDLAIRINRTLNKKLKALESEDHEKEGNTANPDFTLRRRVLALYYLFEALDVNGSSTDKTNLARFTQFITGREATVSDIKNSGIYKIWKRPFGNGGTNTQKDLAFVKAQFEMLGMVKVVETIEKDMES